MFNFIKKSSDHGGRESKDDKERRKKDKKEKKRDQRMSSEELLRLDEVRKSLKITRKRPKEKLPSGITADYTADFLASLDSNISSSIGQSDSSETSLNSLKAPTLPPKPPKRGILKTQQPQQQPLQQQRGNSDETDRNLNEAVAYQNISAINGGGNSLLSVAKQPAILSSPSNESLTDTTTNSSTFATPPFSLSPVGGEAHGFHRWSKTMDDLPLPPLIPLDLPKPRVLTIARQKPPRNDFGFSLRRAMVLERGSGGGNSGETAATNTAATTVQMKAVIFAEPGTMQQHNNETGLLPGDKLLEVNNARVEDKSREEIIDLIKASGDCVILKVQPVAELSELSRRSTYDGLGVLYLDDKNIKGGTLKRSGSQRFHKSTLGKSDEHLAKEQKWLLHTQDRYWLMHRAGFTLCRKLDGSAGGANKDNNHRVDVLVEQTGDRLQVDEDDLERTNAPHFDLIEDLSGLRHLNESSALHTLRQRFANNLIHTYAGGSGNLIVVNPMAPLAIYSEKVVALFRGCKSEDMPPHIYSTAQSAYHCMLATKKDQSVLFTGRSGSGKTTNFRHCAQYLVSCAIGGAGAKCPLSADKLCAMWHVLECFGNCRTPMNANATRFTQIFSLEYDQSGLLVAANLQCFLLEKNRILKRKTPDGDCGFHCLQRLLSGADGALRKELFLDNASVIGNEDSQRQQAQFTKLQHSMQVLGITPEESKCLWIVLASIHHLSSGGATKISNPMVGTNQRHQFANPQSAQRAATLLGTNVEDLSRRIFAASTLSEQHNGGGGGGAGIEALEGFIVGLYAELFNCVTALINRSISSNAHTVTSILLVDAPGFQNGATVCNGPTGGATFEDLCHNYLQERVHLLAHHSNLVQPKERYVQETVDISMDGEWSIEDASSVSTLPQQMVSLLDKTPSGAALIVKKSSQTDLHEADRRGLLWLLDEEAIYPGASDETFLERLFTHFGERQHQMLMRKAVVHNQFVLQHLQGTNPVLYSARGWLKASREFHNCKLAIGLLQESRREELSKLFVAVRGLGSTLGGSLLMLDSGSQSMRRVSSIRRSFTPGAAVKKNSISLQTKFLVDGLIETVRRTKLRFVHCLLPQHNAGQADVQQLLVPKSTTGDGLINVPLLRSQIRGAQIMETTRLYKQGFPHFMPLGEFRRRFRMLAAGNDPKIMSNLHILDERKAVQEMLHDMMDVDVGGIRVGLSMVFFKAGLLSSMESQRDERLAGVVVHLQAHCRGFLARRRLAKRKLEEVAVRCIQRNVRKFMSVRDWPWWRLLVRVTPLLNVHRTEEELRAKTDELEALKTRLEKVEAERTLLKHENHKLESKLSEMTVDLSEEHSNAALTAERLDAETTERVKMEQELAQVLERNKELQRSSERLEMELLYAKSDLNGGLLHDDDVSSYEEDVTSDGGKFKVRYERTLRELEFTKRRMQQQHEDDLEQLVALKKQLEKKLMDAYEEVEEQRQIVAQWKRKVQKLNGESADLRHSLEEQTARNNLLEKKQRRFDAEAQQLQDELRQERLAKERACREREMLSAEKYTLDAQVDDLRMDLESKEEQLQRVQRDLDELAYGGKTEEEIASLRRHKMESEKRLKDQEEELDEMAGQVQLLEQAKLKLEMQLEQLRKQCKKEAQSHEEELEEVRAQMQKKLKGLEMQLESEHEERTHVSRERHELERRLISAIEQERSDKMSDEAQVARLKRDLKKTKALLRDAQLQLERHKTDHVGKSLIRQLKNQIEDLECARAVAQKAKQTLEAELSEVQSSLEESQKHRGDLEERLNAQNRERNDLQAQLEENEEELSDVLKKYKAAVHQMGLDQLALQEQVALVADLESERNSLAEQLAELSAKLESAESLGGASSNVLLKRSELKVKELESKLELEQTTKGRMEVQIGRLKETVEKLHGDYNAVRAKEQSAQDLIRKLQRNVRELRDEHNGALTREGEALLRRKELEKRCETLEAECQTARTDLRLALKRIEDLQSAIQGDLDDEDDDVDEDSADNSDSYSSDESVNTFLATHQTAGRDATNSSTAATTATANGTLTNGPKTTTTVTA